MLATGDSANLRNQSLVDHSAGFGQRWEPGVSKSCFKGLPLYYKHSKNLVAETKKFKMVLKKSKIVLTLKELKEI